MDTDAEISFNGDRQSSAYSESEKSRNLDNETKLKHISQSSDVTTITNTLDLTSAALLITDEIIPIKKVTNLESTLIGIQNNLSNINSNDADIIAIQGVNTAQGASIVSNLVNINANTATLQAIWQASPPILPTLHQTYRE
jgi:hypothetical protein